MEERTSMGLDPKLAAALSYVFGWLTGLIFFFVEKENRYVRFHAMQSILTFGALTVAWILLSILSTVCSAVAPDSLSCISGIGSCIIWVVLGLGGLILWVLLILKAYQGERYKLPFVGEMAERYSA